MAGSSFVGELILSPLRSLRAHLPNEQPDSRHARVPGLSPRISHHLKPLMRDGS
jgi:hypothetical protein